MAGVTNTKFVATASRPLIVADGHATGQKLTLGILRGWLGAGETGEMGVVFLLLNLRLWLGSTLCLSGSAGRFWCGLTHGCLLCVKPSTDVKY